ncbi:MAG: hypothetical protein ABSE56_23800 [Bryobacteraceae bacterium]
MAACVRNPKPQLALPQSPCRALAGWREHPLIESEAIARMKRVLETFVGGIHTSIPVHERILADPDFLRGSFDTNFVRRFAPNNHKG